MNYIKKIKEAREKDDLKTLEQIASKARKKLNDWKEAFSSAEPVLYKDMDMTDLSLTILSLLEEEEVEINMYTEEKYCIESGEHTLYVTPLSIQYDKKRLPSVSNPILRSFANDIRVYVMAKF